MHLLSCQEAPDNTSAQERMLQLQEQRRRETEMSATKELSEIETSTVDQMGYRGFVCTASPFSVTA